MPLNVKKILNRLSFDATERDDFIQMMKMHVDAGQPAADMFKHMAEHGHTSIVKILGKAAVDGFNTRGSYTASWENLGYWSDTEVALLRSAEDNDTLAELPEILKGITSSEGSFFGTVIVPSGMWFLSAIMMVGILLGLLTQESLLVQVGAGDIAALRIAHQVADILPAALVMAALMGVVYFWLRGHLESPHRNTLRKCGFFCIYDRKSGAMVARILGALMTQSHARGAALESCIHIFRHEAQLHAGLKTAFEQVNEGLPLPAALRDILYPEQSALLYSFAPSQNESQYAKGLQIIAAKLDSLASRRMRDCRTILQLTSSIVIFGIGIVLMDVMMGSFIQ